MIFVDKDADYWGGYVTYLQLCLAQCGEKHSWLAVVVESMSIMITYSLFDDLDSEGGIRHNLQVEKTAIRHCTKGKRQLEPYHFVISL